MAKVEHIQYYSNTLNRNINLEVTGHWGHPILMFPSSGGQFTQNTDFGLVGSVMNFIDEGKVKIYNVETIDMMSFYDDHMDSGTKIHNYELYMQFLKNELIPYIQKECNTHRIGVSGVSFGGFHAANTAFRFPDLISHYIGMSAAFNVPWLLNLMICEFIITVQMNICYMRKVGNMTICKLCLALLIGIFVWIKIEICLPY